MWIFDENLRPWLEIVATIVGYNFDGLDWDAIQAGIDATDAERDRWFEYPFGDARVVLARDIGSSVVMARLSGAEDLSDKVELAALIANTYRLVPHQ